MAIWLRVRRLFGMTDEASSDHEALLQSCLGKSIVEHDWLVPLKRHVAGEVSETWDVIGFDTNALKKLRRYPPNTRASLLTYLASNKVQIVLPAQAVQEYWNHHGAFAQAMAAVQTETRKLASRYEKLPATGEAKSMLLRFADEITNLAQDVGDSQNEHLLEESVDFWELLLDSAVVAAVPRSGFSKLGEARMASGVAPGFADDRKRSNGLGDFFVWADFLLGLLTLDLPECEPTSSTIVFVTDDGKEDWLSSGAPHPTLLGEVFSLTGRTLEVLGMDDLRKRTDA